MQSPLSDAIGALEANQREAVLADPTKPLLISAGAGSGCSLSSPQSAFGRDSHEPLFDTTVPLQQDSGAHNANRDAPGATPRSTRANSRSHVYQ